MEQIVFPVPNICEYLTAESMVRVFTTTERDDQGSKVNDFFQQFDNLYNEMRWQKKIRSKSLHSESSTRENNDCGSSKAGCRMVNHDYHPECLVISCSDSVILYAEFFVSVLILPVMFRQKIRLCFGSHATSLFGGVSPSTWPVYSTSLWLFSTHLVMMEMRVRNFFFFFTATNDLCDVLG